MKRVILATATAAIMAGTLPAPAQAQGIDARLERIEQQLRAVQRQVFPGGDERFFEPEITPQQPTVERAVPAVSGSVLTDVLARLDAIEAQLARLTATTEVNENAMVSIETRLAALEMRGAAASASGTTPTPTSTGVLAPARPTGVIPVPGAGETVEVAVTEEELPPVTTGPTDARVAAVQAIVKPATGDAGEDEYVYGFRLWDAGFYPEAQQQLGIFVDGYPGHARLSHGRNLLGRALLDGGDPRAAADWFLKNYRDDPDGARAPDSLLYLAESTLALGNSELTCRALAEFSEIYPALAVGRLQSQYDSLFNRVDCD